MFLMNFRAKHTSLSLIIHSVGTVHLNPWPAAQKKKRRAIKIISSRCWADVSETEICSRSPLLLKSLFPRDKFTGGEVERGRKGEIVSEMGTKLRSSKLPQLRSGPLKIQPVVFAKMYRDNFEREVLGGFLIKDICYFPGLTNDKLQSVVT